MAAVAPFSPTLKRGRCTEDTADSSSHSPIHHLTSDRALKRGRCTEDTADSSSHSPIHHLTDELLVEILHRLPCARSAVQCKIVCKRWLTIIDSDPLFITALTRRRRQEADGEIRLPFGFYSLHAISSLTPMKEVREFASNQRAAFEASGFSFSLSFLPCEDPDRIWILATYKDLVLCCPNMFDHSVYYLCSPVTKHWLALPPPHCHETARVLNINGRIRVGFLCEPYDNGVAINREFRFKLVCIPPYVFNTCEVEIFSSETSEWSKFVLKLPPQSNDVTLVINNVAYNGMIHYMDGIKGYMDIIGFSPRGSGDGNAIHCHCIHRPSEAPRGIMGCFGVCRGRLRVCSMQPTRNITAHYDAPGFNVWELKDYTTGEWTLLHKLCFNQLRSKNSFLCKYVSHTDRLVNIRALTFHPYDEDFMYFQFPKRVVSCNMRTRRLRVAGKLPGEALQYNGVFPVVLPWLPTPLPKLPNNSRARF